ncbi:MAG: Uma2 family endonuclease [Dehalococcoidia bacterium]
MSAEPATKTLTAEEFYQLPDPPEGGKMELVCGRVVTHMPVGGEHGSIALSVGSDLRSFVREHGLGLAGVEVGFRLFEVPDTVRAPDAHFVRADRLFDGRMPKSFYPGYPDLAIEVVSPDDRDTEIQEKVDDYLLGGTPRVWVVRPERQSVTVHTPDGVARTLRGDDTLTSADAGFDVEGFALPVARIFE